LHRFRGHPAFEQLTRLVVRPNFGDIDENTARHIFLFSYRWPLLSKLPTPVQWHSATLQPGDLEKLRLIGGNCGWDDKAENNVLGGVRFPGTFDAASRRAISACLKRVVAADPHEEWLTLLLIAQTPDGPYTILDGNHRAAAMMLAKRGDKFAEAEVRAYIGVSPEMTRCLWCT
jgi:hypothetical protein